jgi:hypothetical protein
VIYADVERWLLTALTQRAAVAFNLGALAATLYLVTVRALAFAWSTTLEVDPTLMTGFFSAIATPWRWLPTAVPSRELVAASRYFPGRSYDPDLLGDWWPFLVAALVTYGLLPRLLLASYAAYRAHAARAALGLDHGECAALCERLVRHATLWGRGDGLGTPVVSTPAAESGGGCTLPTTGTKVRALRWADAAVTKDELGQLVGTRLGWQLASFDDVRGNDDSDERGRLARLADSDQPVLVVAEAFEPPSSVQRLLQSVRRSVGAHAGGRAFGGPADHGPPSPDDVRIWRQRRGARRPGCGSSAVDMTEPGRFPRLRSLASTREVEVVSTLVEDDGARRQGTGDHPRLTRFLFRRRRPCALRRDRQFRASRRRHARSPGCRSVSRARPTGRRSSLGSSPRPGRRRARRRVRS